MKKVSTHCYLLESVAEKFISTCSEITTDLQAIVKLIAQNGKESAEPVGEYIKK